MATQLTLITVSTAPTTGTGGGGVTAPPSTSTVSDLRAHRSADHTGWLDQRTIATGRKGVARARAALADATRRATEARLREEEDRSSALARRAHDVADVHGEHGHAA